MLASQRKKVCQKASSSPKGGRKDQEERARRDRDRIEEGREAHTYLSSSYVCVCVAANWSETATKGIDRKLGKTNKGLGFVQNQQNNKARRKSKTSSCAGKQASKQKLASTKIHTYIKEPKRSRKGERWLCFLSVPPAPSFPSAATSCCLLLLWFLLASPP